MRWAAGAVAARALALGPLQPEALLGLRATIRSMARMLAGLLLAIVVVACGPVLEFEPGSNDALVAGWVAEWGGEAGEYRSILEADCWTVDRMEASMARDAATVPDTPQWREEQGYAEAMTHRRAQLGC